MPERFVVGIVNRSMTHEQSLHLHVVARRSTARNGREIADISIKKLIDQFIKFPV